jgi:hypothetical protein
MCQNLASLAYPDSELRLTESRVTVVSCFVSNQEGTEFKY